MKKSRFLTIGFLFLFLAGVCSTQAGTKTWKAATAGDWFTAANWVENAYPTNGDDVVITNAGVSVLLTNSTAYLGSLTLNKTLVFSNWNTKLSATNITIQSGGTVTLPSAFTDTQMSNNVYFVCSNLTLATGGQIDASLKGYVGRNNANGFGPGAGTGGDAASKFIGGGHGGYGGLFNYVGTNYGYPYETASAPFLPGSSGGGGSSGWGGTGGYGGGAVRIEASGTVVVNGVINANGGNASGQAGGGSGGAVYILCNTFCGTNAQITANAGYGDVAGGGGGGGRIAIIYNAAAQSSLSMSNVQLSVAGAAGGWAAPISGDIGTLYFPDTRLLPENLNWTGQITIPGTNWTVNNLTISSGLVRFPQDGFTLSVSNNFVITGSSARLQVGAAVLRVLEDGAKLLLFTGGVTASIFSVGGNVTLTNGGCLYLYGAETNSGTPAYGALMTVAGDMYVGSNSWVYPQSQPTNGGSVRFQVRSLTVEGGTNGGFDANAPRGFSAGLVSHRVGFGPGGGGVGNVGGGYGGLGGGANGGYGQTYGSSNAPSDPGSGGYLNSSYTGGGGGGLVYLLASRTVTLHGIIRANGGNANAYGGSAGAGSGGGIFIRCKTFIGSTAGSLEANGGGGYYYAGTGGGGRIAVWRINDQSEGPVGTSVTNGIALNAYVSPLGAPGMMVWGWMPPPGTIFYGR